MFATFHCFGTGRQRQHNRENKCRTECSFRRSFALLDKLHSRLFEPDSLLETRIAAQTMSRRPRTVYVEVQPLAHRPNGRLGEGSTSTGRPDDVALASAPLWAQFKSSSNIVDDYSDGDQEHSVYISVEWPEERRLRSKGKPRNLVVLVKPAEAGAVSS